MIGGDGQSRIEGIVLDAVGTLIDPTPSVAVAYTEAAARQGVSLDRREVRSRFVKAFGDDDGDDDPRGPLSTDEERERVRWRRIVSAVLPEVPEPERAFDELWDHFGRPSAWVAFPDVAPMLADLQRAGVPLRVASNFDGRLRGVLLGLPGLEGLAEGVIISSEVGHRKPHAEFYRAACASLGLPPDRVLCVGDDPENDLRGPRRAGCLAVLVDRDGRIPEALRSLEALAGAIREE